MHRRSHAHHNLNPDDSEAIHSSPPPDDTISYASPEPPPNFPHGDIPMVDDPDPLFFDNPLLNGPLEDVPLQDGITIHHPLINGAYL